MYTLKRLLPDDRPREKLRRHGAGVVGDNELIALVLGSGCRSHDALDVANAVLTACGGVHGLARASCEEVTGVTGIGAAKAARLLAAVELGRRTLTDPPAARVRITSPQALASFLLPVFGARPVEHFGVVMLDARHRVVKTTVISVGSLNATIVEPRDVFRHAVVGGAHAVAVFHNHPSGDPKPSRDDIEMTKEIAKAAEALGIAIHDHLVIGRKGHASFRSLGLLP